MVLVQKLILLPLFFLIVQNTNGTPSTINLKPRARGNAKEKEVEKGIINVRIIQFSYTTQVLIGSTEYKLALSILHDQV
jgi:hypothetical protein